MDTKTVLQVVEIIELEGKKLAVTGDIHGHVVAINIAQSILTLAREQLFKDFEGCSVESVKRITDDLLEGLKDG